MRASKPTRSSSPDASQASKARKDKTLRAYKEQGLTPFSAFLTKSRLAQLDAFVAANKGSLGPHGRAVKGRGDALEVILAGYFSDNPQTGSAPP